MIAIKLPSAADALVKAVEKKLEKRKIDALIEKVRAEIKNCHEDFRPHLENALVRYRLPSNKI